MGTGEAVRHRRDRGIRHSSPPPGFMAGLVLDAGPGDGGSWCNYDNDIVYGRHLHEREIIL